MINDKYEQKYLKYKAKYLALKNNQSMKGGAPLKPEISLYKANWCGHCKMFMPVWEKLQENYKSSKIKFTTYDSEKHKEHIEKMNIQGFPTIHIMSGGSIEEYNGDRTYEGLEQKIKSFI